MQVYSDTTSKASIGETTELETSSFVFWSSYQGILVGWLCLTLVNVHKWVPKGLDSAFSALCQHVLRQYSPDLKVKQNQGSHIHPNKSAPHIACCSCSKKLLKKVLVQWLQQQTSKHTELQFLLICDRFCAVNANSGHLWSLVCICVCVSLCEK